MKTKVRMLSEGMIARHGAKPVEVDAAHAAAMIARGFAEAVETKPKHKKGALTEKARSHMAEQAEKRKAGK